jgi:transcriptional regulator with XRE-family HTH domain
MDVGTRLREARHRLNLSLEDVAVATKISRHTLEHIEQNRFDRLPGGIMTKGHLRTYAAHLGIGRESIVGDYLAQCFGESGETLPITPRPPLEGEPRSGWFVLIELVVIALALALYQWDRRTASPAIEPSAPESLLASTAVASFTEPPPTQASPADDQGSLLRIELRPVGPCWVSATADDRLVVERLLQGGDVASVGAEQEIVLRVGDPTTCAYWLNGVPGRPLGPGGRPVTIRITADNYETFLTDPEEDAAPRSPTRTT